MSKFSFHSGKDENQREHKTKHELREKDIIEISEYIYGT